MIEKWYKNNRILAANLNESLGHFLFAYDFVK